MPDPDDVEFAGRFETRSDLGTDKFCAVSNGTQQFNIGFLAVYGPESKCEGTGTATIKGQTVRVVYDKQRKMIVTALPKEAAVDQGVIELGL